MKLILHIGMHKTGSSSIQQTLYSYENAVEFEYLPLGTINHSGPIFMAFSPDRYSYHTVLKRGLSRTEVDELSRQYREKLERGLKESSVNKVILSGEDVSTMSREALDRMFSCILPLVDDVEVVAYVRSPKEFMESAFQQRVKDGLCAWDLSGTPLNYKERFAYFVERFGRDKVKVKVFNKAQLVDGDVVKDFSAQCGINIPSEHVVRVNEGISLSALKLLYLYRKKGDGYGVGPESMRKNEFLIDRISRLGGKKFKLHSSVYYSHSDRFSKDVSWVQENLQLDVDSEADVTEHDDIAVRSEEELLSVSVGEVAKWRDCLLGLEEMPGSLSSVEEDLLGFMQSIKDKG